MQLQMSKVKSSLWAKLPPNTQEKQKRQSARKAKKEKVPTKKTKKNIKTIKKKPLLKGKEVRNLKKALEGDENEEEYYCIMCNEKYESPPTEDWIMCATCKLWAHEQCTNGETSTGYVCNMCVDGL